MVSRSLLDFGPGVYRPGCWTRFLTVPFPVDAYADVLSLVTRHER